MTRLGFDQVVPLLFGLLAFRAFAPSGASNAPRPVPGPAPPVGTPGQVPTTRTGEADVALWKRRRLALLLASMQALEPPVDVSLLDRVGLSIVAQWAHETDRGRKEFNFNLGGWRARRTDPYFAARDTLEPGREVFRWTAYPSLPVAVDDQLRRLIVTFPSAWALLLAEPESSAWVEELGRRGYYTAKTRLYARAWAMQRTELEGVA